MNLFPWRERAKNARIDTDAARRQREAAYARRPMVDRITYELGMHARQNHFVDVVAAVAKGIK